jgi:F-type H+-transporting ATPase subunit b
LKMHLRMGALACTLIALNAAVAGASGGEAHTGGAPTVGQWILLLFTCINFAAFVYLLRRFTSAPLRDFLTGRRKEIVDLMAEAAREKAEAEALKRECEAKLAGLERAKQQLIDEVRRMAESDAQKLLTAASEAAARLKRDAERAAQSDHDRVVRELRAEAARLAATLATEDVVRHLDAGARERLLDEFLQGMAKT